jgi:hypothetical protein
LALRELSSKITVGRHQQATIAKPRLVRRINHATAEAAAESALHPVAGHEGGAGWSRPMWRQCRLRWHASANFAAGNLKFQISNRILQSLQHMRLGAYPADSGNDRCNPAHAHHKRIRISKLR